MSKPVHYAIFKEGYDADGNYGYWREDDFPADCFGGIDPTPGDIIVAPFNDSLDRDDRSDPEKCTVYEVVRRYLMPRYEEYKYLGVRVALVVEPRKGRKDEAHLIVGGG